MAMLERIQGRLKVLASQGADVVVAAATAVVVLVGAGAEWVRVRSGMRVRRVEKCILTVLDFVGRVMDCSAVEETTRDCGLKGWNVDWRT